jgi:lipopolysaccharide/colanic/teichoic acid biosynthesis glycosyltransferase
MELILQAPGISLEQPKKKAISKSKVILRIDNGPKNPDENISLDNISFSSTSIHDAVNQIQVNDSGVEAVLVNPENITADIVTLKEIARKKAVPIILYTPTFEQSAKKTAFTISADDYHFGEIDTTFLKRVEFIKKVKTYKNVRGNKPYVSITLDQVPQVKLWTLKRAFDILVSATALLFLSPLCALVALIIKLESRGPVFYISKRAGTGYKIFNFYKFRSMRTGSDLELEKLAHLNQYNGSSHNGNGVFFKIKNDPRITRFGQFIRNTSLDEIPQLLNVLTGDMSLVGNRPLPLYEAEKLTKDQIAWRFLAPAGITGLWQITKRGKDNMSEDERIALDMEYAMKNSFWLDMKILFSTIPALFQKEKV